MLHGRRHDAGGGGDEERADDLVVRHGSAPYDRYARLGDVGILTDDMQRVVRAQRLGFVATVDADGTPNLSPKGTTDVWDGDHLWFADICSPHTVDNVRRGSWVEVNVVDPFLRKGYRFKGPASVHDVGTDVFVTGVGRMVAGGSKLTHRVQHIVLIEVRGAAPVTSPAYDDGTLSEADVVATHAARFAALHPAVRA